MSEKLNYIKDGSGREVEILPTDDFKFVQNDKKIHDLKFNTKATTFFRDAIKRFTRSKAALTGGIIVSALILLAIIVPFCTPDIGVYNVSVQGGGNMVEALLPPKLFPAGTGFWDGTVKRTDVVYDTVNEKPANYNPGTWSNLETYEKVQDNVTSEFGTGGFVNIFTSSKTTTANFFSQNYNFDSTAEYNISYVIEDVKKSGYEYVGYNLALDDGENLYYLIGGENSFVTDGGNSFNLFDKLEENGYNFEESTNINGRLLFTVKNSNDPNLFGFLPLKSVTIDANTGNEEVDTIIEKASFKDGNEAMLRTTPEEGMWTGNIGGRIANQVTITYCSFTFDTYMNAYGERNVTYGSRELTVYELNGTLSVDFKTTGLEATTDPEILTQRFKPTEDCPIVRVVEQVGDAQYNAATGRYSGYSVKAVVMNYKIIGHDSMPSFIFGTNKEAKDYLKLMFTGLRFSFILAFAVSAVNITIGLIWGSISGYFGGWTDIMMERFCDILAGLPSTVIITLCILYGNEFNRGSASDVLALMLALFMTGWMGVAHQTRTQFYRYKGREYVLASRTLGAKDRRLIFRHILPNAAGTIITGSVLIIPSVIYTEASIAYLGLGLQNQVLFGVILSSANQYYRGDNSFLLYIPTFVMMLLLVSFNLFGNGLRDAFNPQLKGSE